MLSGAMGGVWDAMLLNRRASDFNCKLSVIFERMVQCGLSGTTAADVARTCQECVPLALSSLGGAGIIASWQAQSAIHEGIATEMSGTVNYQTGEVSFKTYSEYFGHDED